MKKIQRRDFLKVCGAAGITGALAACSSSSSSSTATSTSSSSSSSSDSSTSAVDLTGTTVTVELYDRSNAPDGGGTLLDNYAINYIYENFTAETGINVEYVTLARSSDADQLQVLMAGGTAPDVCFLYERDRFMDYASAGGLCDITEEMMDTYAPDLKAYLGSEVLSYGYLGDDMFAITEKRTDQVEHSAFIRKDLVDAVGMDMPTNPDELREVIEEIVLQDPAGIGSANYVGYGMHGSSTSSAIMCYSVILHSFIDPDISAMDSTIIPVEIQDGAKEGFRYLNELYNDGLLSVDFALDDTKTQFEEDLVNSKIIYFSGDGMCAYGASSTSYWNALRTLYPEGEWVGVNANANANGDIRRTIYDPIGRYIMIPKANEANLPQALTYLNWLCKTDNLIGICSGVENTHFEWVDGLPMPLQTEDATTARGLDLWGASDLYIIGKSYGTVEDYTTVMSASYGEEQAPYYIDAHATALIGGYNKSLFNCVIEAESSYSGILTSCIQELVIKSIMASPDDFDAVYDAQKEEWYNDGGTEVVAEKIAAWENGDIS